MNVDWQSLRIEGIYRQPHEGFAMLRIKLPAGVFSASQARGISVIATEFTRGTVHLTTRGSIELHWVREEDLAVVKARLTALGLTSRGACGGAVRGITCAGEAGTAFPAVEALARRLQRHFTGNPRFERLPKKFKVGIVADYRSRGHLIQDMGLVIRTDGSGAAGIDVWIAGGLGREPQAGFLLEERIPEGRIIPLIEAVLAVYAAHASAGRRLKHVVRELGQEQVRALIMAQPAAGEELAPPAGLPDHVIPGDAVRVVAPVFAGELPAERLDQMASFAETWSGGWLVVTSDQNIIFPVTGDASLARQELERCGYGGSREEQVSFKICPGSHECRMGLAPTREVARQVIATLGPEVAYRWAISGCHNSCAQPQIADYGIVATGIVKGDDGGRSPRFDIYRGRDNGLGEVIKVGLSTTELLDVINRLCNR